jgi:hypothetical protein
MKVAAPAGIAIVAAHVAAFVLLAPLAEGTELSVYQPLVPLAAETWTADGHVPDAIADRVTSALDRAGPGLRRKRWSVTYRGGFERTVGATQLVGPFQQPDNTACSGRIVLGQRMLDSIAPVVQRVVDFQLQNTDEFGIGKYVRTEPVTLRWARFDTQLQDASLLGDGAPHGYIRATMTIVYSRVSLPVVVVIVPEPADRRMEFRVTAHVDVAFGNRALDWLGNRLPLDTIASHIANRQLSDAITPSLAPPPPFRLDEKSSGQELRFLYCNAPVEIVDGAYGALPFGVEIRLLGGAREILPPHFPRAAPRSPDANTLLAIDLDLDALNAMLYELWRTGWLDTRLADIGLDRKFNTDPIVTEYLSVRLSPLKLALPPVIEPDGDKLRLAADARVTIGTDPTDARQLTIGRVYGSLALHVGVQPSVDLGALELACEREAYMLVPCYADLVAALADRGDAFHGALTDAFTSLLDTIFVERHVDTGFAEIAIHRATPSLEPGALGIHLELDASVVQTR